MLIASGRSIRSSLVHVVLRVLVIRMARLLILRATQLVELMLLFVSALGTVPEA